ncbi:MAG: aminopeptidase [Pseudomonadota bacterium]
MNLRSFLFHSAALPILVSLLGGCYYGQAASGQFEVIRKREPIARLIDDPDTPPELVARLELVNAARDFSIEELGLPDNKSYRGYADLEREYVVWNVFAAPEFSLEPETWCFPVAGCVAYRGYFKRAAAERQAQKLAGRGLDVHVGGVTAYSTLGKFNDPVLNTMLGWDDVQLASVLFHELAHQRLYVKGDSAFNESFATAVEEFAIERFLEQQDRAESMAIYRERKRLRVRLMSLVDAARHDLEALYASGADDMRAAKAARLVALTEDIRAMYASEGRAVNERWIARPFNNARIASMVLYDGRLPAFRAMLDSCAGDLECFYAEAERLAELPKDERDAALDALAGA